MRAALALYQTVVSATNGSGFHLGATNIVSRSYDMELPKAAPAYGLDFEENNGWFFSWSCVRGPTFYVQCGTLKLQSNTRACDKRLRGLSPPLM